MPVFNNVLELIGNTPIVRVNHLDTGPCELFLKLESANPGGSIKDRIALKMIDEAERRGDLKPGQRWSKEPPGIPGWAWPWWRLRRATG